MIHELLPWILAIAKYILASAVLLVFYRLFLRQHASFRESRLFLLSVAFLALAVSQFRIEVTHPAPTIVEVEQESPTSQQAPLLTVADGLSFPLQAETAESAGVTKTGVTTAGVGGITKEALVAAKSKPSPFQQVVTWIQSHLLQLLLSLYMLVGLTLVINLLLQYRSIRKLRRTGMSSRHEGYTLVEHPEVSTPFSFATTIFLPSNLNASQRDIVVTHELWHIRHKHYVDVLVQEITCCLFWFNPIQWLLRKDLRSVHEYQADRSVLNEGCDVFRYQTVILEEVLGHHFRLANGFNQSFTKKRFIQMKQFEPLRLNTLRKVASVCFLVLLFAALSVVPGKSQVIRVERSSTTNSSENSNTKTVSTHSADTLSNTQLVPSINLDPAASLGQPQQTHALSIDNQQPTINSVEPTIGSGQLQHAFNLSLDSLQRMINRALPIAQRLTRSPQPAYDKNDMNALVEALIMKVNKQAISYNDLSTYSKNKLTQPFFQGFEKTLMNIDDSIRLYRTYKVDNHTYTDLSKTLAIMLVSDKLVGNLFFVWVCDKFGSVNGTFDLMVNDMTSMHGSLTMKSTVKSSRNNESSRNKENQSQRAWANIANNDDNPANRMRAVKKLTDQRELGIVVSNEEDRAIRMEAVKRLTDQNELSDVAFNEEDKAIRKLAVQKLTNQSYLADVAFNEEDPAIRLMVVKKLTNFDTLSDLVDNDDDKNIRKAAIARMEQLDKELKKRQPK